MITAVKIKNLRGIVSGELEDLRPLTLLTGPNGCGKSTVLDALLIGASPKRGQAIGEAVSRRARTRCGARWLVARGGRSANVILEGAEGSDSRSRVRLTYENQASQKVAFSLAERKYPHPYTEIHSESLAGQATTGFAADNRYFVLLEAPAPFNFSLRLVDPGLPIPLDKTYSEAVRQGRKQEALDLVKDLVPGMEGFEILTEDDGLPALYINMADKAVPVGLAGDGVQALIQLCLELAAAPGGMVLVEEPEVYQHPRSIWQTARALLAAMRRQIQLVITTHSLELIDALVAQATEEDLEKIVLFNLALTDGQLHAGRFDGPGIALARQTLENDLR